MASGSFNISRTSGSSYLSFRVNWSSSKNDVGNYSNVVVSVYVIKSSASTAATYGTANTTVNVGGSSQSENNLPFTVNPGETKLLFAKSYKVNHNTDGSKTVNISASISGDVMSASGNSNVTLDKIPRASTVSCTNANIGSNATINIVRNSNSFTHTLTYTFGNLSGTIATKTSSTSVVWTLPTTFYSKIPNSNSGVGTITCITYSGNTEIGRKTCGFTAYVTNSNPIFNNFTFEDINSKTLELTGNNQTIIKGYSKVRATISSSNKATAQNSATMSYYQLENAKGTYSSEADVIIEVDKFSNNKVNVAAVDSRGNSTNVSKSIDNFIDYSDVIKDALSLSRNNNGVGKFVTLNFNGVFWNNSFGEVDNTIKVDYLYKKTNETEYTTGTTVIEPTIEDNNFSFNGLIAGDDEDNGFEIQNSYDVIVIVSDKLSKATFTGIIGAGTPGIAFYKNKVSIGDKYNTNLGGTQLWGNLFANGINLDYVVASGISNGWIYRKWKNGLAECWKKVDLTGGAFSPAWGEIYPFSASTGEINYPFAFKEIPIEVASISRSGSNACFLYKESATSNTINHTANYRPGKGGGNFSNQTITVSIQVVGKWK